LVPELSSRSFHHLSRLLRDGLALSSLIGPARTDPVELALRQGLVSGLVPPAQLPSIALAARYGEVSVLAAETIPALAPHLTEAVVRQKRIDALLELGLEHAARAIETTGLQVALLKGTAAAAWAYPHTSSRFRRDLDLLVGPHLLEVRAALLARGWRDDGAPLERPERGRTWSLVLPLGKNRVALDLHRTLVHSPWCTPSPESLLAASVPHKTLLPVTNPVDTFLHTALHLVGNGFHEPLKGWVDLLRLLPLVSPEALSARARAFRLGRATWLVLHILERWFGLDTSAHRAPLAPSPAHQALLSYLAAGDHATPERQPLPRALSWRLWRTLVRESTRGNLR
jgi:hypothetical protein